LRAIVEIGRLKVVNSPMILVGTALGSCIGLMLYDERHGVAGLAHIMLPVSIDGRRDRLPAKFADQAIPLMLEWIATLGGEKACCRAKLAGGAQMFYGGDNAFSQVGVRNVQAVKARLTENSVPVVAEDTGGDYARTVEFNTENFQVLVKSITHGKKWM
jgi:chemotaxis protein CheD